MPSSKPPSPEAPSPILDRLKASRGVPLLMGVVNATPDSFYQGSRAPGPREALARALRLADEGADLIDLGGQSTRPGSEPLGADEEWSRLSEALELIASKVTLPISVDTYHASVARKAREAGATILNDITALRNDGMLAEAVRFDAVVLMHMQGENPKVMQKNPVYKDVVGEVKEFLSDRVDEFVRAGGDRGRVIVDPGIGFGKDLGHNLSLIKHIDELSRVAPVLLGVSRKSFLGRILSKEKEPIPGPEERLEGSLAIACLAALKGVKILRVHDVLETRRALEVLAAVGAAA